MKVLLTKPYKDSKGKWHDAGNEIDMNAKEAKRVGEKGGCVKLVTPVKEEEKTE